MKLLRTPSSSRRADAPGLCYFGALVFATVAMLLVSLGRWHLHATHRPVALPDLGRGGAVVVYQERDCPDARSASEGFLHLAEARGIPASSIMIPQGWGRAREVILRQGLHRAILRSGLGSTPVVLLVDGRGTVRFTHPIRAGSSLAEMEGAVDIFKDFLHLLSANEEVGEAEDPFKEMEG